MNWHYNIGPIWSGHRMGIQQYHLPHFIQKRQRIFEEPVPVFEPADTTSREPYPKRHKMTQTYSNNVQESNNRIAEMQESTHNQEFSKLHAMNTNFASQIETLKIERKSALSQLEEYRSKLVKLELELERKENEQPQSTSSSSGAALARKQQKTYERYARAESARKALVYQKKYLLLIIGGFQETEESTLKLISKMGGQPSEDLAITPRKKPIMRFRAAVRVCIAVHRYVHAHFDGHFPTI